ncbi:hypothetical protein [Sphingomonas sp. LHG3406-1]|uniref:hypothetical protein n=1 Tax=Sphingomonas sp. LHG3406-1 TaxID=2804617 RepID=UPI0026365918|nr:hypothetical protein [Sphingomonas sp. LHG3406-1]
MPIPDEKARAWTRPEDYWPPRRPARSGRPAVNRLRMQAGGGDPLERSRPLLGTIPYMLLMVSLAVLAIAIFVAAWPGRQMTQAPAAVPGPTETGTAPKGWMDRP